MEEILDANIEEAAPLREPSQVKTDWLPMILVFMLGFGLYVNTFSFQFALDDKLYVTDNRFVKSGTDSLGKILTTDLLDGFYKTKKNLLEGGRYRPLPLITHAIEIEFSVKDELKAFEESRTNTGDYNAKERAEMEKIMLPIAHFDHFVNTLFYGLTVLVLYLVLLRIRPPNPEKPFYLSFAFIATVIFAAHPLHTEVIANIKSRDEIMAVLGGLTALLMSWKYVETRKNKFLILTVVFMFLGLMSKETSITFVPAIPLTLFFFSSHYWGKENNPNFASSVRLFFKNRQSTLLAAGVFAVAILWLVIRTSAIDSSGEKPAEELMNFPFKDATGAQKFATIFYTMGLYIKLLLYPSPLTHDYYPYHIELTTWGDWRAVLSLVIYVSMIGYAVYGFFKKHIVAFGLLIYLGNFLLFSNLFFSVGAFMNERFMYIPSIGFAIIITWVLTELVQKRISNPGTYQAIAVVFIGVVVAGFGWKTVDRNKAWENDKTLALTDVEISVNSAKVQMSAGSQYINQAELSEDPVERKELGLKAIAHLKKSISIHPKYFAPTNLIGNAYYYADSIPQSIYWFDQALGLKNTDPNALSNLFIVSEQIMRKQNPNFDAAIQGFNALLKHKSQIAKPEIKASREKLVPSADIYKGLGEAYSRKTPPDPTKSLEYLEKAVQLAPNDPIINHNLGIFYGNLNNLPKALTYFQKATELAPNNVEFLSNTARTLETLGRVQEAQALYARIQQLNKGGS